MRVAHVITGLTTGGAQAMLHKLVSAPSHQRFNPVVISLTGKGVYGSRLEDAGVPVHVLGLEPGAVAPQALLSLARLLRDVQADVVHSWMYHANFAATLAWLLTGRRERLIWNVRHSIDDLANEKFLSALMIRLGGGLSFLPERIVYNSAVSARQHQKLGYRGDKTLVIANGFDTERFSPSPERRVTVRRALSVGDAPVIGLIARVHPMKDHATFFEAARRVVADFPAVRFVVAGATIDGSIAPLEALRSTAGLDANVILLGERSDVADLLPAFDLLTLSSAFGEAFPNVVGEAMSAGVACVVTDVGDAGLVVGDTGRVVAPRDPEALAAAMTAMLRDREGLRADGLRARSRIQQEYSLPVVVRRYEQLYAGTAADRTASTSR